MRQLVLAHPLDSNGRAVLEGSEYRYLVQVLRSTPGTVLEIRLPDGILQKMTVYSIDRKEKRVVLAPDATGPLPVSAGASPFGISVRAKENSEAEFPSIVLFQWILKGPKMDQVIRQATETGVLAIIPVSGERCLYRDAGGIGQEKTGRWERIVREARQQSGSPIATRILPPVSVSEIHTIWQSFIDDKDGCALVLTEAPLARKSLHEYLVSGETITAIAIGPEGGMSQIELSQLSDAGFECVHFKTNILRAETAALYGIAAVQSALMESEKWQLKE